MEILGRPDDEGHGAPSLPSEQDQGHSVLWEGGVGIFSGTGAVKAFFYWREPRYQRRSTKTLKKNLNKNGRGPLFPNREGEQEA